MDNNCVAIAMVSGLGLAFFLGMGSRTWWQKGIAFGSAAFMGHVILFSFSRGGILSMALTGCMAFALIPKKPQHYLAFGLALLLAIRLAGPEVRERFFTAFEQSEGGTREASASSRRPRESNRIRRIVAGAPGPAHPLAVGHASRGRQPLARQRLHV